MVLVYVPNLDRIQYDLFFLVVFFVTSLRASYLLVQILINIIIYMVHNCIFCHRKYDSFPSG